MAELWRLLAFVEMVIMLVGILYLVVPYRQHLPDVTRSAYPAFAVVFAAVALGVVANVASPLPPTPGVKVLAVAAAAPALWIGWLILEVARGRR